VIYTRLEYWIKIFIASPCNSFNFIVCAFLVNSKATFLNTIDIDKNLHNLNIPVSNPTTEIFRGFVQRNSTCKSRQFSSEFSKSLTDRNY
jgi:hypothetical protein